jgi:hypothetical protein
MATTRAAVALRTFLVECYVPAATAQAVSLAADRLRSAAAEMRLAGREIDYAGSLIITEDEVVFHVFHARDAAAVRDVAALTSLACERVVESIPIDLDFRRPARRELTTGRCRP